MADYLLLAQYPKSQTVRDRNFSGLLAWSGYQLALPVAAPPDPKPTQAWVEQRLLAERIPTQTQVFVDRTMGLMMMDVATQTSIRSLLSQFNDEQTEADLSAEIAAVLAAGLPAFAHGEIPQEEVDRWWLDHGFA